MSLHTLPNTKTGNKNVEQECNTYIRLSVQTRLKALLDGLDA